MATIGVLPLARPTFDIAFAETIAAQAFAALEATGHDIIGPRDLLFDAAAAEDALAALAGKNLDLALILQVTFTDAAMTVTIAETVSAPLAVWAFPEPRLGGRLRLNAFCGLNLAAHALGLGGHEFGYLYAAPDAPDLAGSLSGLLAGKRRARPVSVVRSQADPAAAEPALKAVRGARIGRIGGHPDGFHTCAYDPAALKALAGVEVDDIALGSLFETARQIPGGEVAQTRAIAAADLDRLETVDAHELDRSLRLKAALDRLRADGGFDAFAIRCWPEMFTEYGGAVCGPVAMMGERKVPCACEADVYGALTSLILQSVADGPAFLADLVDIDTGDGTAVVWHCGQAPVSMADPGARPVAAIHSNRKMPLLYEFPLKPGRVTLARVSQARGEPKLVIAGAEMLKRPLAFSGTAGVLRFDAPADTVLDTVIGAALEHHMALVYGDIRNDLMAVASALDLPVLAIK